MRPLCCGMRSHPYSSSLLLLSQCRISFLYLNILSAGCLSSLLYPNFYLNLRWVRLRLFRAHCSGTRRLSSSGVDWLLVSSRGSGCCLYTKREALDSNTLG